MKTYIHPIDLRMIDIDVMPTGTGLYVAGAALNGRKIYASEPAPRQQAMCKYRSLCHAAYDCGLWPAPMVVLLYLALAANLAAIIAYISTL